jgi:hypothetical protein
MSLELARPPSRRVGEALGKPLGTLRSYNEISTLSKRLRTTIKDDA